MRKIIALWVLLIASVATAAQPLFVYEGDGLTVRVTTISEEDATVGGELVRGGKAYPFTGELSIDNGAEVVTGSYSDGTKKYPFTTTQREGDTTLILSTGGKQYRLSERDVAEAAAPAENPDHGPLGDDTPAADAQPRPKPTEPIRDRTAGDGIAKPGPANGAEAKNLPPQMKFSLTEFRDINMGNVVAYTMLVPEGFTPEGHIEWSQDRTPYPQMKIKVVGKDRSQITFMPASTFTYSEATQLALQESAAMGMRSPIPEKQGVAPPQDLGAWVVDWVRENNKEVSNVRLVSDKRDAALEAMMTKQSRDGGNNGSTWEVHQVVFTYDLDGVPFTEELNLTYARNEPMLTRNINMWNWMLFVNSDVRAPSDKFEAMRPVMMAAVSSMRTVPKWFTQSQHVIMEITRRNHQIGMDQIRERGRYYDQLSDQNMADWKAKQKIDDARQNERINLINGTADFKGPDGNNVKLPNDYNHYYVDEQGNYIGSNRELNQSGLTPLEPQNFGG